MTRGRLVEAHGVASQDQGTWALMVLIGIPSGFVGSIRSRDTSQSSMCGQQIHAATRALIPASRDLDEGGSTAAASGVLPK